MSYTKTFSSVLNPHLAHQNCICKQQQQKVKGASFSWSTGKKIGLLFIITKQHETCLLQQTRYI